MTGRRALVGAGLLLALAAFAAGLFLSRSNSPPLAAPQLPPQAATERLLGAPLVEPAGKGTTLARWQGKPLVVNFWATWCPPCLTEMPVFSRLQEKHPGIQFVGIAVDTSENVINFGASHRISYPLLVATDGIMSLMADLGNDMNGLPFTVAIDAAGHIRHVRLGGLSEADTENLIASLR